MTDAEKLLAIEEIKKLKARYFLYLDTKNWDAYKTVFTHDVVMDARECIPTANRIFGKKELMAGMDVSGWIQNGPDEIVQLASGLLAPDVISIHQGMMPQIELQSQNSATGMWSVDELLRFPAGSPFVDLHGWGHYQETYVRVNGNWLIKTTKFTRLRLDIH